ncbi:SDR family oxidoreductase [Hymenobacter cellulosivorans]|uniref:SDR family oxidoreductase n=1 Tax=Hymenobacter cellulosivorans TaxID=2932249 RepID=A0ABY4F436_9BACT|nr:SDR family oxidoreductase [Hymenobacter cellulosivorans]UOQ51413.1 SDR family oxidoreductase [Hymenobacter cellulosivorans]
MSLTGKNAVICGGTTGIGFAAAQAFLTAGATVWITGRGEGNLQAAAAKLNSPNLRTVVADTSGLAGIAALEQAVQESGAAIHVLLLNSAIVGIKSIEQTTEAEFDAQFNTNVKGHYFTLQKLLPYLADGASVLFTSSASATTASLNTSVYAATKAALNKIAKIAANELAGRKIRVNVVSPGPIATELLLTVPGEVLSHFAASTALQRLGQPEELAKALLFLASDDASFVTGTELLVDGGLTNYAYK